MCVNQKGEELKMGFLKVRLATIALIFAPHVALADQVIVFAAASLQTALDQIANDFERATGHNVLISYGGSGALARQISQGAPADIFLSAGSDWMDVVQSQGLVQDGMRQDLLGNQLVVIAHKPHSAVVLDRGFDWLGLLENGNLSVADIVSVPAGQYAKAGLEYFGQWAAVEDQVVQSTNVRAALALVAIGEAQAGIVYASDAVAEPRVHVAGVFPERSHPPIIYPLALLVGGTDLADRAFYEALQEDATRTLFEMQGFLVKG